jgi:hypothetical protein
MTKEILQLIFDKNPGLLNILFTGVLLPLGILWLTNRHNRKQRESEKSLDIKYNSKIDIRHQKTMVYSSLSKILFDVQQLHVSLSGTCVDNDCITSAVKKFDTSVSKYHSDISNNMLYLSTEVINLIYKFYRQVSELRMELNEIDDKQAFDMAPISVFYFSQVLADTVIEIQEIFIKDRSDLKIPFDKKQQEIMKNFCGSPPPETLKKKYDQLKQTLIIH